MRFAPRVSAVSFASMVIVGPPTGCSSSNANDGGHAAEIARPIPDRSNAGPDASTDASAGDADIARDASVRDTETPQEPLDLDATALCHAPTLSALSVADTHVDMPYPAAAPRGGESITPGTYYALSNTFYQGATFTPGTTHASQVVVDPNTFQIVSTTNDHSPEFRAFGMKYLTLPKADQPTRLKLTGVCPAAAANTVVLLGYTFAGSTLTLYDDAEKRVQVFTKE